MGSNPTLSALIIFFKISAGIMNEKKTSKLLKVHLGCGKNALDGFLNFDNNLFLFFKFIPFIENFLSFFKFIPKCFGDNVNELGI